MANRCQPILNTCLHQVVMLLPTMKQYCAHELEAMVLWLCSCVRVCVCMCVHVCITLCGVYVCACDEFGLYMEMFIE